jgi:hypothetical protein
MPFCTHSSRATKGSPGRERGEGTEGSRGAEGGSTVEIRAYKRAVVLADVLVASRPTAAGVAPVIAPRVEHEVRLLAVNHDDRPRGGRAGGGCDEIVPALCRGQADSLAVDGVLVPIAVACVTHNGQEAEILTSHGREGRGRGDGVE